MPTAPVQARPPHISTAPEGHICYNATQTFIHPDCASGVTPAAFCVTTCGDTCPSLQHRTVSLPQSPLCSACCLPLSRSLGIPVFEFCCCYLFYQVYRILKKKAISLFLPILRGMLISSTRVGLEMLGISLVALFVCLCVRVGRAVTPQTPRFCCV